MKKKVLRCSFIKGDCSSFKVKVAGSHEQLEAGNDSPVFKHYFSRDIDNLSEGTTINLIDTEEDGKKLTPTMIVVEPDYLIDISTLADCIREYGDSPANYHYKLLTPAENTLPLLLGNIVNMFLDEWIHARTAPDYTECMRKAFSRYAIELSTCKALENREEERKFFRNCRMHFEHIEAFTNAICQDKSYGLNPGDALIEPSYICNHLGIQGRLDYMQRDMSAFIEMKSGKACEYPSRTHITPLLSNKAQMMLYLSVLHYNMGIEANRIRPYLLYTRYPLLYPAYTDESLVMRAMSARNRIVRDECSMQKHMSAAYTETILGNISPEKMNEYHVSGTLWNKFQKPQIERFHAACTHMSTTQKQYFLAAYNFITKEIFSVKTGAAGNIAESTSALWLLPLNEKKETGSIITDMKLAENNIAADSKPYAIFRFDTATNPAINFRTGDQILVYERNDDGDCVSNKMIFKGNIEHLSDNTVKVRFRNTQKNSLILPCSSLYALEPDKSDKTLTTMYSGLYRFATANEERRKLLTGERKPEHDPYRTYKTRFATSDFDRIAHKAMAAKDFFLLIGPPGTGKTSKAIKRMVEMLVEENKDILLLAYTNRAVDEICKCLSTLKGNNDFIRLGSELSCDEQYKKYLIENRTAACSNRMQVKDMLQGCRIFVSTVMTMQLRMELFAIKHFDCAVIDEAAQIPEPHLTGILSAKDKDGNNAIAKFIMVGDNKQLPAVIVQDDATAAITDKCLLAHGFKTFKESMFERLYRNNCNDPHCTDMLCTQGRMHPAIADFPNRYFYDGKLRSLGLPHQTEILPDSITAERHDVFDFIVRHRTGLIPAPADMNAPNDKINANEAKIAASLAHAVYMRYKEKFLAEKTLGIIAPYRSQIVCIKNELKKYGIEALNRISIDTVERYQGSERDVIIYSFCLNKEYQIAMLSNIIKENGKEIDRKLNVALTRARKQLFITGNPVLLEKNEIFKSLLDYHKRHKTYFPVKE